MDDFEDVLRAKLARNTEIDREREEAERELARREREQVEEAERRRRELQEALQTRHADLVHHLQQLIGQLDAMAPGSVVARTGWTESREEFIAKLSSVQLRPHRSLFLELDRDDDEVLARWTSDLGQSIEMWRLLDFTPDMLSQLVLQVVDQEAWRGQRPPPFPGAAT
ncbi:MAG TPA: hypothetical protein VHF25_06375 [Nitriliruptorales bacterium]|nr:hypothetical protein [Nitriliruptorales bacterium]